MKNFKFYLVAGLMTISTSAFAQFANTGNNNAGSTKTVNTDNYSRIFVSYNPTSVSFDADDVDDISLNGFAIGYTKGFSISKSLPLFIEAGLNLNYAFKSIDNEAFNDLSKEYDLDLTLANKYSALAINVPVSLAYKFALTNSDISISPFVGVNFKFNVLGKMKYNFDGEHADAFLNAAEDNGQEYDDVDFFDKDQVGKDGQWTRFQIGWHIGAGINYKALYVGLKYGTDFTELCKKTNTSNWAITLGYNF